MRVMQGALGDIGWLLMRTIDEWEVMDDGGMDKYI